MAVTNEAELFPQGPPRSQSPHQINGSCKKEEISVALNEEKKGIELTSVTRGITLSPNNIMPRPVALISVSLLSKNPVVSPTSEEKKGSVGQWIPVKNEENSLFHNFLPKSTTFRACY
ncbi:hypothetical protein E2320_000392 [Naja naja]|nr:hypothetical protein E2320_000392 [Naja naja]